jgi:hypothetical protein
MRRIQLCLPYPTLPYLLSESLPTLNVPSTVKPSLARPHPIPSLHTVNLASKGPL